MVAVGWLTKMRTGTVRSCFSFTFAAVSTIASAISNSLTTAAPDAVIIANCTKQHLRCILRHRHTRRPKHPHATRTRATGERGFKMAGAVGVGIEGTCEGVLALTGE